MNRKKFNKRLKKLAKEHQRLLTRPNKRIRPGNGLFHRYKHPVLTAAHTPLYWRYDLNRATNPHLMERLGINGAFNAGAIELDGKILLAARVEGYDRKSFLAVAESATGVDRFRFWDYPILMPETDDPDVNVYDIRLVKHEDGWIYGLFCSERRDPDAAPSDTSAALAQCGIARTRDLRSWERLADLKTGSPQQRNVVLHPELVDGKYAFYTRPMDGFIDTGTGSGIGWGLSDSIEQAEIPAETIIDEKVYHTIKEVKNGQGPAPIKTAKGWLHVAHGVRATAAGLRYVLYVLLSDLRQPDKVLHRPGGYFLAPVGAERVGDVSNVVFCNGLVARNDGTVFIYYASSDTRMHVLETTVDKLLDYAINTPEDPLRSHACVVQRNQLISKNLQVMEKMDDELARLIR